MVYEEQKENIEIDDVGIESLEKGDHFVSGYTVLEHIRRGKDFDTYYIWSKERLCGCIGKTLRPDRQGNLSLKESLIQEGECLKKFTHPNLVRAYEVFTDPSPNIIMEVLTGQTLSHLIESNKNRLLPVQQLAHLGTQLCSAMYYLHQKKILHLDLKPSNIICQPPHVKVIDLSIAGLPGQVKKGSGTRRYMAPEQAQGNELSAATDVWGVGTVLFYASTGRKPFRSYHEKEYDQIKRLADPVRSYRRIPVAFANIIDHCLHPDPVQRPNINEVAKCIKEFL